MSIFQALLGLQAVFPGQRPVMRGDMLVTQALGQVPGHAFGDAALVDEDQGGAMRLRQCGKAVVDFRPDLRAHHRIQRRAGHFQGKVAVAAMAGIDDMAIDFVGRRTTQVIGHFGDGRDGRRQADARRPPRSQRGQPFQRQHQVRTALAAGQRVQLVNDYRPHVAQHRPAGGAGKQDEQRLRRGDQHMRRQAAHQRTFAGAGVAGAHRGAQADIRATQLEERVADAVERCLQVLLDVVRECLQRRYVEHLHRIRQRRAFAACDQLVERDQERGQRLARTGRRRHEHVGTGARLRPGLRLRCRRALRKGAAEPARHRRMETGEVVEVGKGVHDRAIMVTPRLNLRDAASTVAEDAFSPEGRAGRGVQPASAPA